MIYLWTLEAEFLAPEAYVWLRPWLWHSTSQRQRFRAHQRFSPSLLCNIAALLSILPTHQDIEEV